MLSLALQNAAIQSVAIQNDIRPNVVAPSIDIFICCQFFLSFLSETLSKTFSFKKRLKSKKNGENTFLNIQQ